MRFLIFSLLLLSGNVCLGQSAVVDASGREVRPPAKVERVYAAGPPASVLVFAIAPDKLVGWTRAMRDNEVPFFPEPYGKLPELGRLTGRGNTANVEVVIKALHPFAHGVEVGMGVDLQRDVDIGMPCNGLHEVGRHAQVQEQGHHRVA